MPKLVKWDRIEILWIDSYRTHGWLPLDEADLENDDSLDHRTIGYYVGQTKRAISVCQSSKTHSSFLESPDTQVDAIMSIPKKAIVKISKLRTL